MPFECRVPLLFNHDVTVYFACPSTTDDVYFANGDGDELWFIEEGSARIESVCGWLPVKAGDYVWIPRSLIHRWHLTGADADDVLRGSRRRDDPERLPEPHRSAEDGCALHAS